MSRSWYRRLTVIGVSAALALGASLTGAGAHAEPPGEPVDPDDVSIVTLTMPDGELLGAVVSGGYDLDHDVDRTADGFAVTGIVTNAQIAELEAIGVGVEIVADEGAIEATREARMAERDAAIEAAAEAEANLLTTDEVVIARADYFTSTGDTEFLSVEAKSSDAAAADLTVEWDAGPGTAIGDGGSATMDAFVDAGEYLYHRVQVELNNRAALVIAGGSAAGSYTAVGSAFGPPLDEIGLAGAVELAQGAGGSTLACDPLIGFTPGSIALVDRGSCAFVVKVANAQAAGAAAVVVVNNNASAPFAMTGTDPSITIPSAMISQDDGAIIRTGLPATGTLAVLPALPPPTQVRVTSSGGGSAEVDVTEWLADTESGSAPAHAPGIGYESGFLDHYPDAHELMDIIEQMHAEFPELTEIIDLPYETNGYRRAAMHLSGGGTSQRVVLTSLAWGHEGGNDLTIEYASTSPNATLGVTVSGDDILVRLATNAAGTPTSTAAQVVAAINADAAASLLVTASTYRGNAGSGAVVAAGPASLDDQLGASESTPREPFQVKALRIGTHRDGSKTGVLTYSQEHAREWQTPLVNIESAYRMLHNYQLDSDTRRLVDNLDIFIVPTVNPDGALYSYYDFAAQRKNMTNYCGPGDANDVNARNAWGVDNNRNQTYGSIFDGYDGASTSCTSATYAGPFEQSEPESRNLDWIATEYPNIEFAMNIHSSGNYFMWSPGAYSLPGRVTLPRPSLGTEQYFYDSSERILSAIKEWRGLSVTPARTGPIADVLYSAAGNSGDQLWYVHDIYAWNFEVGTSFQPEWSEAYEQMMEFSNGVVELYQVAKDWTDDRTKPRSWLVQPGSSPYSGPVAVQFDATEPVTIHYTLDGSNPTYSSPVYESAGIREGGESILIDATTTVKWFSVDESGNVERNYKPGKKGANQEQVVIATG
ncbi:M14 family metallopeptidase [Agromyces sp. SYSU T00266]|uniref:M14 family metallopeptidase n=1 Tax=Agromyces zhanjiangensis TaxID=3158562 RepID=UPI003393C55D